MSNVNINRLPQLDVRQTTLQNQQASRSTLIGQGQNVDFKTLLDQQIKQKQPSDLNFSKHAQQRVSDRQIDLSDGTLIRLNDAVMKAKAKGVKDALILNGDTMFIVNTGSNTVVTALKGSEMKDNVFTNIDGTVIM